MGSDEGRGSSSALSYERGLRGVRERHAVLPLTLRMYRLSNPKTSDSSLGSLGAKALEKYRVFARQLHPTMFYFTLARSLQPRQTKILIYS